MAKILILTLILASFSFPVSAKPFDCGIASFYEYGAKTASGEPFNPDGKTAAHKTLAFGTRVTVINQKNGKEVTVTINDRGPFNNRIIDLSRGAAREIGITKQSGIGKVCLYK